VRELVDDGLLVPQASSGVFQIVHDPAEQFAQLLGAEFGQELGDLDHTPQCAH